MISARRSTISCHFRMISEGTSIECATLEAVILRLRSGPFSVDTLVHAEQFLGLDGEGSITAPAAACDSLFDHFAARASNAAGISRPRAIETANVKPHLTLRAKKAFISADIEMNRCSYPEGAIHAEASKLTARLLVLGHFLGKQRQ